MNKRNKLITLILLVALYNCLFFVILEWKSVKSENCNSGKTCVKLCSESKNISYGTEMEAKEINPSWASIGTIKFVKETRPIKTQSLYSDEDDDPYNITKVS